MERFIMDHALISTSGKNEWWLKLNAYFINVWYLIKIKRFIHEIKIIIFMIETVLEEIILNFYINPNEFNTAYL